MQLNWFAKSSDRKSPVSRVLRALGQTWSASPVRRLVQAACFALFLGLFFYVAWPGDSGDFEQVRRRKEVIDIELFLALDPLVSIAAAIAARAWVWSLWFAMAILGIGLVVPRAFCGYMCPMGTLVDLFDWAVGNRLKRFRLARRGWWRNLRYFILAAVLIAAAGGVMLSGYVAAIPTVTRGLQFVASPIQLAAARGRGQVPPISPAQIVSITLFALVLLLGLLRPRFWCRHVCPSGAIFSVANLLRLTERKVGQDCIRCGKCSRACSFDAINDDFTTAGANCAFCQTCGGVCPVHAISFTGRFASSPGATGSLLAVPPAPTPTGGQAARGTRVVAAPDFSRRGFLVGATLGAVGGGLAAAGVRTTRAADLPPVLRPPGSVTEDRFLRLCVRCGQCLRVCPSGILQPSGLGHGLDRLWTPIANPDWAGCQPTCNNCGQVCPTGAIAALSLDRKRRTPMGLAEVDSATCLACQDRADCETSGGTSLICRDACEAAGYSAILVEGESHPVPTVRPDRCVGCGLCQAVCYRTNVVDRKLLALSAIRVRPNGRDAGSNLIADKPTTSPATPASSQPQPIDVPYSVPDD